MVFMEDNIFDLKEKVSLLNKELNQKDIQINEQCREIEHLSNIFNSLEKAILNTYPCMNKYEQDFKTELLNILKDLNGGK